MFISDFLRFLYFKNIVFIIRPNIFCFSAKNSFWYSNSSLHFRTIYRLFYFFSSLSNNKFIFFYRYQQLNYFNKTYNKLMRSFVKLFFIINFCLMLVSVSSLNFLGNVKAYIISVDFFFLNEFSLFDPLLSSAVLSKQVQRIKFTISLHF
jgi:hypothetical protein